MSYLTDLDQALAARGIPFTPVGYSPLSPEGAADWRTRGRPGRPFDPEGILCHHTAAPASASTQASLNVVLRGNSQAPGPIAQLFLSREPVCYLVAAGRCNHGGGGIRPGIDSGCTDMNRVLLGIEVDNDGIGERWGDDLILLYARVVEALCSWYRWEFSDVYLHATTGPPSGSCNSKIDPAGPWLRQPDLRGTWDLNTWRNYCAEQSGGPSPAPAPPTPGDDDMPTPCGFISCNAGTVGHHADGSEYRCPVNGTTFRVNPGGTIQWVHGGELEDTKAVMSAAGVRTDTWNGAVAKPDVFGRLVGDKPA